MPIRILLADDHLAFRESLRQFLEADGDLEIVAEAGSGSEAVELSRLHRPDVAVLDVRMRGMSGIQAIPRIRRCSPQTVVVMLSMHRDARYVTQSLEAGALEYVTKDTAERLLVSAIRRACITHRGP
jgi:DNA-binding NarL/FixJ family response regulator